MRCASDIGSSTTTCSNGGYLDFIIGGLSFGNPWKGKTGNAGSNQNRRLLEK
jgi:hypothetical protein